MRKGFVFAAVLAVVALLTGSALADHFDSNASTGSFNPQFFGSVSQGLVNRPTNFSMRLTQQDHEDPPVVTRLRTPGDWQFAFSTTRQAEATGNVPTTRCSDTYDGRRDSPNGTGTGTQLDYSKRTNARFTRAEKIGRGHLEAHIDGVSRPGGPIVWNGDIAFVSWSEATQTATACALFITTDTRVTTLPDTNPSAGGDDIEDVTEIEAQFPVALVTDASGTWWETLIDLTGLVKNSTFQRLHVSVLELSASFSSRSVGNWHAGAIDFSRAPAVSGNKEFRGIFKTCPAADPSYGNCFSGRTDVTRIAPVTFTLPAPAITGPAPALYNVNPLPVTGTSDPFASIQLFEGAVPVGSLATADATGAWTANAPLADGRHTLVAKTVDAGSSSPASNSLTLDIDTTAPVSPIIGLPAEGITHAGTMVTFSGSAEPLSNVELFDALTPIGSAQAAGSGSWSITTALVKGPHMVQARATDIANNTGPLGATRSFDVTTAMPSIITPTHLGATNTSAVTFTGVSEPAAAITLDEAGTTIGTGIANGLGSWSIAVTLPEGEHSVTATALAGGFTSPPTPLRAFTIDLTAPLAPGITSPVADQEVRSISVPVFGTAEPFTSVAVFEGAARLTSAPVDASGAWSATVVLADGEHTLRSNATDRAGNVSPFSASVTFIVNDPLAITSPLNGALSDGSVTIIGTADPASSQVRVFEGFTEIGRARVVDGAWTLSATFPSGSHTIRARAVTAGVVGPLSDPVTFTVDATPPVVKIRKPSGFLLFGKLINTPLSGYANDMGPSDTLVDHINVSFVPLFGGSTTNVQAFCRNCPRASVEWATMPGLTPGVYEVTATAFDRVGNSSSETLIFLIV